MSCADEFLAATNPVYQECSDGVTFLDRALVSIPSALSSRARTALVPALYAYWERFFRTTFGEFLRVISLQNVAFPMASPALTSLRLRGSSSALTGFDVQRFNAVVDKNNHAKTRQFVANATAAYGGISNLYSSTLNFGDPSNWIKTESNVRYEVLETACEAVGVDIADLKAHWSTRASSLYVEMKELVDTRNKIAHGETIQPMSGADWSRLTSTVFALMNAVQLFLYEALVANKHLL